MKASYEWLRAFVPAELSPVALRDLLTARAATVDEMKPLREDLKDIVVGYVVEAARHPDSDHLSVTKVDAGGGVLLDVVCGASNVQAGRKYPFAGVGTVLPGGLKLEKRKIRGALSQGMLCSSRELGLGDDHDGILELHTDAPPGTPFLQAMPVGDTRYDIDISPNRPDLLSHAGLAREIAAATGVAMRLPSIGDTPAAPAPTSTAASALDQQLEALAADVERMTRAVESGLGISIPRTPVDRPAEGVRIEVRNPADAPRYVGIVMRGVTVGPSPSWLVRRLESVGARSINNVVDATNYVMLELGQPLHAFDVSTLAGSRIVVRRAEPGETLRTLDGVARTLDADMTVIADGERAQALAGIMGGADSEVRAATRDILIEAANFDPRRTRLTRRRLGLSTDASYRFERGVDIELAPVAAERAATIIAAVAGGEREGVAIDVYPVARAALSLSLSTARVSRLLGEAVSAAEIARLLSTVGFGVSAEEGRDAGMLRVAVPTWRSDILRPVDLVEEVARLRGYDSFPNELRPYRPSRVPDAPLWGLSARVREMLVREGLFEVRPMPFTTGGDATHVRIRNPIAENEAHLRADLLDTLARRAEYNLAHMQRNVRLFEIGSAFAPRDAGMGAAGLPREELRVAVLVMGDRRPAHFTEAKPPAFDEWDARGIAERLAAAAFPGAGVSVQPPPASSGTTVGLWEIRVQGQHAGHVTRVMLDAPVWAAPAFGVELTLALVESADVAAPGQHVRGGAPVANTSGGSAAPLSPARSGRPAGSHVAPYVPLPATPASEFDLALLLPPGVAAAQVETVVRAVGGSLLERLMLFDEFTGAGIPEGFRSLAWRLTLRHPERTLRDKEIDARRHEILRKLESELGVKQRSN